MKKQLSRIITFILILLVSVGTVLATIGEKTITVMYNNIRLMIDGTLVTPKDALGNTVEPFIYEGTTYLPVRAVANALGKNVSWDEATQTVIIGDDVSVSAPPADTKSLGTVNTYGNSPSNIVNGGLAALQGDWIYYTSKGIFKIKTDGTGWTELYKCEGLCKYLNVVGDWIYYQDYDDGRKLYKIHTDGTERTQLTYDECAFINVVDGWIYYQNVTDGEKLYKIRIDGTGETKLYDGEALYINVYDGWIYFSPGNYNDSQLYKIRTDGTKVSRVSSGGLDTIALSDGLLYYSSLGKIHKVSTDGTGNTMLNFKNVNWACSINVTDGWIYFAELNGYDLYKIKTDGTGYAKIIDLEHPIVTGDISVVGDWIYFSDAFTTIYKVKTDGTGYRLAD